MAVIELIIEPRNKDLGGFTVARILPFAKRRMVGPFIFLDHLGPAQFGPGEGINVRPHPHIGLATVTYLFSGEIVHRDTLGSHQAITPGDVNWMTAGRGIAHSERTSPKDQLQPHDAHGLQSWVALPKEYEENAPEFFHHAGASLPQLKMPGVSMRLIAGGAYGVISPVRIYSPLFYADVHMEAGSRLDLPEEYAERAVYLIDGAAHVAGTQIGPRQMPVFGTGRVVLEAQKPSHLILLGGEPLAEQRFIWWNFVSSSRERIVQAQEDWKAGRFGLISDDEKEFIPLPAVNPEGTFM